MSVTPELDARFREAAVAAGLVDVRYDIVPSPVGELLLAATPRGLRLADFRGQAAVGVELAVRHAGQFVQHRLVERGDA